MSSADVARLDAEAFRFTFVRDPYGRALSAFADKVVRKRKQARPFYRWLGRVEAPAFIDFLRFLEDGGGLSDAHWAPQADLMLLPVTEFHFVGRLERLEADLSSVVERVFAPGAPLQMRRAGPRTDSHRSLAGAYTPEAIGDREPGLCGGFRDLRIFDACGVREAPPVAHRFARARADGQPVTF